MNHGDTRGPRARTLRNGHSKDASPSDSSMFITAQPAAFAFDGFDCRQETMMNAYRGHVSPGSPSAPHTGDRRFESPHIIDRVPHEFSMASHHRSHRLGGARPLSDESFVGMGELFSATPHGRAPRRSTTQPWKWSTCSAYWATLCHIRTSPQIPLVTRFEFLDGTKLNAAVPIKQRQANHHTGSAAAVAGQPGAVVRPIVAVLMD